MRDQENLSEDYNQQDDGGEAAKKILDELSSIAKEMRGRRIGILP